MDVLSSSELSRASASAGLSCYLVANTSGSPFGPWPSKAPKSACPAATYFSKAKQLSWFCFLKPGSRPALDMQDRVQVICLPFAMGACKAHNVCQP